MDDFIQGIEKLSIGDNAGSITQIHYTPETYHVGLFEHYSISKPELLGTWLPQRQAQFLAGRLAAKESARNLPCANEQITIGQHREPIWPTGYVGSISHSENTSIAAITKATKPQSGLGIDIQSIIDSETQAQITPTILSDNERMLIQNKSQLPESVLFTLIFSAKESFFKAAFNEVGRYFDFDAVELVELDIEEQRLGFETAEELSNKLPNKHRFDIDFVCIDLAMHYVMTYFCR